jgi:DNA-binding transcriptional regulator YdaS (Cro superfamily)
MSTLSLPELLATRNWRPAKLAKELGINKSSVTSWIQRRGVPPERVLEVEALTGISRHDLRPDIYPLPEQDSAA